MTSKPQRLTVSVAKILAPMLGSTVALFYISSHSGLAAGTAPVLASVFVCLLACLFVCFLNILYWLCYYSCPILPLYSPPPCIPPPKRIPPLVHVIHTSFFASAFPMLFLTAACLFCTYYLCFLFPVPFPLFSPLPLLIGNPPCDLHFCDSVPVLVVCSVCVCLFRFRCW